MQHDDEVDAVYLEGEVKVEEDEVTAENVVLADGGVLVGVEVVEVEAAEVRVGEGVVLVEEGAEIGESGEVVAGKETSLDHLEIIAVQDLKIDVQDPKEDLQRIE